jgi:hypothetical protein
LPPVFVNHTWRRGGRTVLSIAVGLALMLGISACGSGETTVTVTETVEVPAEPDRKAPTGSGSGKIEPGVVAGYTDNVKVEADQMVLSGWAASADLSQPATRVEAIVDGKVLAEAVPTINREDVVEALGKPGLEESGFELRLPSDSLDCGAPAAGIQVIGSLKKKSSILSFGEGVKEAVSDAC